MRIERDTYGNVLPLTKYLPSNFYIFTDVVLTIPW